MNQTMYAQRTDSGAVVYMPAEDEQQLAALTQQALGEPVIIEDQNGPYVAVPIKANRKTMTLLAERGVQLADFDQATKGGQVRVHEFTEQSAAALQGMQQGQSMADTARTLAPGQLGGLSGGGATAGAIRGMLGQ